MGVAVLSAESSKGSSFCPRHCGFRVRFVVDGSSLILARVLRVSRSTSSRPMGLIRWAREVIGPDPCHAIEWIKPFSWPRCRVNGLVLKIAVAQLTLYV